MSDKKLAILGLTVVISMCACGCTVAVGGGGGGTSPTPDADDGVTPGSPNGSPSNANEGGIPNANEGVVPDGGPDRPAELEVGRDNQSLAAGATRTFRINAERGETLIVNTSLPDSQTNVDMYAYAPDSQRPIASSNSGPGKTDNLMFAAEVTGEYIVEVVNISPSEAAELFLDVQRIPPRSGVSFSLNGVYEETEIDGVALEESSEAWVFSDGKLASIYGSISAEALQAMGIDAEQAGRYWIDATTGEACPVHFGELEMSWRIVDAQTEQDGSSLTLILEQHIDFQLEETRGELDQTFTFEGTIAEDGRVLRGSFVIITDDDPTTEISASLTLERKEDTGGTQPEGISE